MGTTRSATMGSLLTSMLFWLDWIWLDGIFGGLGLLPPNEKQILADIDKLRDEFTQTQDLYREVCTLLRNGYEKGVIPKPFCDPELTLVLAQSRQEAKSLVGPNASDLLPAIPRADIHRAIKDVLPTLCESLEGDERNVLLTLARMWRTLVTGNFVSKDIAADWAVARLPPEQAAVLADAREDYLSVREKHWQNRQHEIRLTVDLLHDYVLANL